MFKPDLASWACIRILNKYYLMDLYFQAFLSPEPAIKNIRRFSLMLCKNLYYHTWVRIMRIEPKLDNNESLSSSTIIVLGAFHQDMMCHC